MSGVILFARVRVEVIRAAGGSAGEESVELHWVALGSIGLRSIASISYGITIDAEVESLRQCSNMALTSKLRLALYPPALIWH